MTDPYQQVDLPMRTIKSFVRRRGRNPQQDRVDINAHTHALIPTNTLPVDWKSLFGREAPLILEIGFGMGQALLHAAREEPDMNHIGIDVHTAGVARVCRALSETPTYPIRIFQGDAVWALEHLFAKQSIQEIRLWFPDPWPKQRHHKRRLVQLLWLKLCAEKMLDGGLLRMATDWEDYAKHMLHTLNESPYFKNTAENSGFSERCEKRPLTKFEQRGIHAGHAIFDVCFQKKHLGTS